MGAYVPIGGGSSSGPTGTPADNVGNPTAIPESMSFGMLWDPTAATWNRAMSRPANGAGLPATAPEGLITLSNVYGYNPGAGAAQAIYVGASINDSATDSNLLATAGTLFVSGGNWARARAISASGDVVGTGSAMQPSSVPTSQTSGANAANTVTYGAVVGQKHRLTLLGVSWSGAAATTGTLTVTDNATVVLNVDVPLTLNQPFFVPLPPGGIVQAATNTALTITVAAGGAGAISKLNTAKLTG